MSTRHEQFAAAFEPATRNDGTTFARLKDGSPDWMTDLVHAAHDDMMPDDTRYSMISECADSLTEYDPESWSENAFEICDGLVDVYNSARSKWLASHLGRAYYVDQAQEEGLIGYDADTFTRLGCGQFMEYQEILSTLINEFEE